MWRSIACSLLAMCAAAPARAGWLEARTPHFIIYSQQNEKGLARYADQLERFDQAVRPLLQRDDPPLSDASKLTIYALADQEAVANLAGQSLVAGFYVPRASGALAFVHRDSGYGFNSLRGQMVFQHEYLHHLVLQNSGDPLPRWASEGLAEFFGTARVEEDGSVGIGYVPQYRANELLNDKLPLTRLLGPPNPREIEADTLQVYARGWLLVHYLTFSKDRAPQFSQYLKLVAQGRPQLDAAVLAFGDLRVFDRELDAYLKRNKFDGRSIPASMIKPGKVTIRALSPAEAAIIPVQMRSQRGVNAKTAPAVLQSARRVAAQYPSDPMVLAALAEAQDDAGDQAGAIASADRAIALNPRSQKALVMKARAMMGLAAKEPKKADFRALRQVIAQANRIDPDNAEPLLMFYQTYGLEGATPTKNSVDGLYYAVGLVPQDDGLRFAAVRQLVIDNNLPMAARLFGPIAYNPHATKPVPELQTVMAALQSGNKAAALAAMDSLAKQGAAKASSAR